MTYAINEVPAGREFSEALYNIADVINEELGIDLNPLTQWIAIENIAKKLNVRFNEAGEIISR